MSLLPPHPFPATGQEQQDSITLRLCVSLSFSCGAPNTDLLLRRTVFMISLLCVENAVHFGKVVFLAACAVKRKTVKHRLVVCVKGKIGVYFHQIRIKSVQIAECFERVN